MVRIGELAELVGVTTRTIRHYHRIGLLPDAARAENGYRSYGLGDAVRLLRIRRLVELGLSLEEVANALADGHGDGLREILVALDADLGAQEVQVRQRRQAVASLLEGDADLRLPAMLAPLARELAVAFGASSPSLERELLVLELLGSERSTHHEASADLYRRLLADPDLRAELVGLTERFEALADLEADDPAIDALVADATGAGDAVAALLPEELRRAPGDPDAADLLLDAVTTTMAPAPARCLTELFETWRRASS